jgi:hypothetical protein
MRRLRLLVTVAAMAGCVSGCSGFCRVVVERRSVAYYLKATAGIAAVNCGMIRQDSFTSELAPRDQERLAACATDAYQSRRPFYFSLEGSGIDSYIATGLIGASDGTLLRFRYDDEPCGGDCCNEQFSLERCAVLSSGRISPGLECAKNGK